MSGKLIYYFESVGIGGDSKYLYELMNNMSLGGYEIKCFCNSVVAEHLRQNVVRAISIVPIKTNHTEFHNINTDRVDVISRKFVALLRKIDIFFVPMVKLFNIAISALSVYRVLSKETFDVLHVNNGGYPAAEGCIAAIFAGRLAGARRIIMSVHSQARDRYASSSLAENLLDKLVVKSLDAVIVATDSVGDSLYGKRSFPRTLITTIRNGVSFANLNVPGISVRQEFVVPTDMKVIVMLARFDGTKGHEYLVEALSLLKEHNASFRCFFLGDGPFLELMVLQSKQMGIHDNTVFTGYRKDVLRFLQSSDMLINPTVGYENAPYSVLEAMACALPVVGTSVGGIPELIEDGKTGFIVPPRDPKALYNAIRVLMDDEALAKSMGLSGRQRVIEKFNMADSVTKTQCVYFGENSSCPK
jgi:glycosyltransferase involved in cell wall biosynthesis